MKFFFLAVIYLTLPIFINYISKYIAILFDFSEKTVFTVFIALYFLIPYFYVIFYPNIDTILNKIKGVSDGFKYHVMHNETIAERDPYVVLGISNKSTNEDVKHAFHSMLKKYHPDHVENMDQIKKNIALEMTKKITIAFSRIRKERGF